MWKAAGVEVNANGKIIDAQELQKAKKYNECFTKGRLTRFRIDGKDLADVVIKNLKQAITARFGERVRKAETPLQKELDQQTRFLQTIDEGYIERKGDFDAINHYLSGSETRPFAIAAYAGMGKTSLLAHFIDVYRPEDDETLHYRFIGGSDDSASVERLVRSLLNELKEAGKITSNIPSETSDMLNRLPELLCEAGKQGRTILVIDALNQLETGMNDLFWIPAALPDNVKLIVSFKRGDEQSEAYYRRIEEKRSMILHNIRSFDTMDDRKKLVTAYLERYFKELDEARAEILISSEGAENPLFLKIALSELRIFGVHSDLTAVIRNKFGNTPARAFDAIMSRMEADPAYSKIPLAV
jgi:hypothetical protein